MKTINAMMLSLAALTIAGCSQNEVTEISPDAHPQVGFGVYTGVPTRGVDMTTESMKDDPTDAINMADSASWPTLRDKITLKL